MPQSFARAAFKLRIDALQHDAARASAGGQQNRVIDRRLDRAHAGSTAQPRHQSLVIADSLRADGFQIDVRGDAQQAVADRLAKSGVHRERDHQRGHARRHADHRQQRDKPQHRRPVRRTQIPQRHQPFEAHLVVAARQTVPDSSAAAVRAADSARNSGNRITSRMACESVSSITSRSMPMPSPAVGGSPWLSARI